MFDLRAIARNPWDLLWGQEPMSTPSASLFDLQRPHRQPPSGLRGCQETQQQHLALRSRRRSADTV